MYHFIVRRKVRRAFEDLNAGRYGAIVAQFAKTHRHAMHGEHALGGTRTSLDATREWYGRLQRLLPGLKFQVLSVASSGWPWDTRILVSWRDEFRLPDGMLGANQGVHELRMAWGRVTSLDVHCDTARLQGYCRRMEALGLQEAVAAPITG